jgi:predicted nucleic acid-binding protein
VSRYVVDASVAVKWYLPEPESDAAGRLLDPEHDLIAPDLLFAEVGNALWKRWRRGEIGSATCATRSWPLRPCRSTFVRHAVAVDRRRSRGG